MSKEIGETVGGKRYAYLLLVLSLVAFMALWLGYNPVDAAEMPTAVLNDNHSIDAVILNTGDTALTGGDVVIYSSQPGTLAEQHQGVVASFAQTVRNAMESGYTGDGITNAVSTSASGKSLSETELNRESAAGTSNPLNALLGSSLLSSYLEINTIDKPADGSIKSSNAVIDAYAHAVELAHGQTVEYFGDPVIGSVICDVACSVQENRVDPAVEVDIRGVGYIIAIFDERGNAIWFDDRFANAASIRDLGVDLDIHGGLTASASGTTDFWKNYQNDVLNAGIGGELNTGARPSSASLAGGGNDSNGPTASMHVEKAGKSSAAWLYTALALGALAFGIGGIAVARRSR